MNGTAFSLIKSELFGENPQFIANLPCFIMAGPRFKLIPPCEKFHSEDDLLKRGSAVRLPPTTSE